MSYILDALKKAERDRRRPYVPSLGTVHTVPVERRRVWPWVIGGLAAANVVGFSAILILRPAGAPPTPAVTAPVAAPPPAPAAAPVGAPALPSPVVAAPTSVAPVTPRRATPVAPDSRTATAEPAKAAAASPTPPAAASAKAARVEPDELKLEVLVYSPDAAQRAVYINGHRYVEGQRLGGRLLVETILADSVVLSADGRRHVLRQE